MNTEVLEKSFELMVVGMGTTFLFLILLVVVMIVLGLIVNLLEKRFPQKVEKKSVGTVFVPEKLKIALAVASAKHFAK